MKKIKVACFFGGRSAEYQVSLMSATAVIKNIDKTKYEVIMIGINEEGKFFLFEDDIEHIYNNTWEKYSKPISLNLSIENPTFTLDDKEVNFDIAFPILHGANGEDGTIQGMFELLNIKYVGCDLSASFLCMDKHLAKLVLTQSDVNVAKSVLIKQNYQDEKIIDLVKNLKLPLFIKPIKAGSSFGISKIEHLSELTSALNYAYEYDTNVLVEECISGFEVGCAIIGNDELIIGAVDEIELQTEFFDYDEKYSLKTSKIHLPARISVSEMERVQAEAIKIYKILNCRGCARIDMFYTPDKKIIFNEVNTMPGFTDNSRFPNMLKAVGYSFENIVNDLIKLGLQNV